MKTIMLAVVVAMTACAVEAVPSEGTTNQSLCIEGDEDCGQPGSNPNRIQIAQNVTEPIAVTEVNNVPTTGLCFLIDGIRHEYSCVFDFPGGVRVTCYATIDSSGHATNVYCTTPLVCDPSTGICH